MGRYVSTIAAPGSPTRAEHRASAKLCSTSTSRGASRSAPIAISANLYPLREGIPERRYVDALADLDHELPKCMGASVTSVFFGGGTPSLFAAEAIDEVCLRRARVSR